MVHRSTERYNTTCSGSNGDHGCILCSSGFGVVGGRAFCPSSVWVSWMGAGAICAAPARRLNDTFSVLPPARAFHLRLLGHLNFACASFLIIGCRSRLWTWLIQFRSCTISFVDEGCNPIAFWAVLCGHRNGCHFLE